MLKDRVETLQFESAALGRTQPVTLIPPSCLTESGHCFTLFLLHGMGGDHTRWVMQSRIHDYLVGLPILTILPAADESFYLNSALGNYEDFLARELIAFADARYPTLADASGRATTGLSMGGYGALLLALRNPQVFGAAASHSGAVLTARSTTELGKPWEWSKTLYGEGADGARKRREHDILSLTQRFLREDSESGKMRYDGPALYLDCGTEDFLYYASRELTQALRMAGVPYEYHEYPGDHDWLYWDRHVLDSLRFHCRRWGLRHDMRLEQGRTLIMHIDEYYMRRTLRLAVLGRHASPNPMVGCVLVNVAGQIVGEGFHPQAGQPHAEVFALRDAGEKARGATAYVSLEPCSHQGRTPPCAEGLLAAGVTRVVAAMTDPDPRVGGRGLERLRQGGVEVSVGVCEAEARTLNAAYLKHRTTGLPYIVLKTAMTLDGKIATQSGDSKWITSPIARKAVHRQLRDRCDGILTGVGTVLADDPALTTRLTHKAGRNPWRIVVDSRLRTPLNAQIVRLAGVDGKTLLATMANADPARREALEARGCQVIVCADDGAGRVSLPDLMQRLGTRGDMIGVLVESGDTLAAGLLTADLVDRWLCFIAPKVVGGRAAPGPIGNLGIQNMAGAYPADFQQIRRCGTDIVIDARFG